MMKKLMLEMKQFARGAYEAGVSVVSSYPGTPSTEITENIVKYDDIYVEWAPNEKVAAEVAIGASIAGARSMSCMKHVGLNVMADPVFTTSYTGVNGGLIFALPMTKVCTHHRMNRIHVTMQKASKNTYVRAV